MRAAGTCRPDGAVFCNLSCRLQAPASQMDERRRRAIDAAAHAFASARLDTARSLVRRQAGIPCLEPSVFSIAHCGTLTQTTRHEIPAVAFGPSAGATGDMALSHRPGHENAAQSASQSGSYQQAEPDFISDACDFDTTSASEDGDDGPASCDYSDEDGEAPDESPSYGALLPPGPPHGSPRLLDFAAASYLPGGYFGFPAAALAPARDAWALFSPRAASGAAQPSPALSAFAAAPAGAGEYQDGGMDSPAPDAGAPNLNPFAAQRKRSWALMQQAGGGEEQPGGVPPRMRHRELDTLRAWSLDCARHHGGPHQVPSAAAGGTSCMPASMSSMSLPPTEKPRSFSADLRELSQLDCEARGFRPASCNSPSVADIHRMAARLSGIVDAATEGPPSDGVAGAGGSWPGSMTTTSLPSRIGSAASRARASTATLQRHTAGPASGDAGERSRAAARMPVEAQHEYGTLRSGGDGGVASRAASSDLDTPLATAWSWAGMAGAAGPPPPSSNMTAAGGAASNAAAKQDALPRLRPSMLAGKPPLAWQLGTRSNSGSTGTASLTPSMASTSWAATPRSLVEAAVAASQAAPFPVSPFGLPAFETPFRGTPADNASGFVDQPGALHARGRSTSLPLGLHRLRASMSAANPQAAAAALMPAAGSAPDTAHALTQPGLGRTVRALSMPVGGPRLERPMSNLGRVSTLVESPGVVSATPQSTFSAATAAALN